MFKSKHRQDRSALEEEHYMLKQFIADIRLELMVLELDVAGKITSCNSVFEKEFGSAANELVGQPAEKMVPDSRSRASAPCPMMSAIRSKKLWIGHWEVENLQGECLWLRGAVCPIKNIRGELDHFTIFASNLTDFIESANEHENQITAMQRSMAVIEFDLQGHVLNANKLFLGSMGYSLDEIKGQHHRMFCPPEVIESPEYERFWERLRRGEFLASRFKRVDKHGREQPSEKYTR